MSVHDNVIDAINAAGIQNPVLKEAMAYGAYLEGGWRAPFGVGDQGNSHGPFQINLPFHPGVSSAQAEDAAFAVGYMEPAYQAAFNALGGPVSDTESNLDYIAYHAERPAQDYPVARGQQTVDSAYQAAKGAFGGGSGGPSLPSGATDTLNAFNGLADQLGTVFNPFKPIAQFFADFQGFFDKFVTPFMTHIFLPKTWARVAAFTVGVAFVLVGVFLFFTQPGTATKIVEKTTEVAGTAAAAGAAA